MNFETLISPYQKDLYAYCLFLTGSKWDGEDLYQDTLLKTFIYSSNIVKPDGVKALLFKAAKHIWIDVYRKRSRRVVDIEWWAKKIVYG